MRMSSMLLLVIFICTGCSAHLPLKIQQLDRSHTQAVHVKYKGKFQADVTLWQYQDHRWINHRQYSAVVGRSGIALENAKKEGDGYTPSGIYALGPAFGYSPHLKTGLKYIQVNDNDFWVDDVNSAAYNTWVKGIPDAKSYEILKRKDDLYKMAAIIDYNAHPIVPGNGSAIFLHIWRNYRHPTSGCVALSERNVRRLLKELNQDKNPVIIIER